MYRGSAVTTTSLHDALVSFLQFLEPLNKPLLVGHNIASFDCPVLTHSLKEFHMAQTFSTVISGCIDTRTIAKLKIPKESVPSYRQEDLVTSLLKTTYNAHNALADVMALQQLYETHMTLSESEIKANVFAFLQSDFKKSFLPLKVEKVLSELMIQRLAKSGFSLSSLKVLFKRDSCGFESVMKLHVTKREPVITALKCYLAKMSS